MLVLRVDGEMIELVDGTFGSVIRTAGLESIFGSLDRLCI